MSLTGNINHQSETEISSADTELKSYNLMIKTTFKTCQLRTASEVKMWL